MKCKHLKRRGADEVCTCAPGNEPMTPSPLEKEKYCRSSDFHFCPVYRAFSPSKVVNRFVCGYLNSTADRL